MTGDFSSAIHCRMKFDPIKPAPPVTRMVDCMERQQSILIKFDELGRMCTQMSAPALKTSIMRRRFAAAVPRRAEFREPENNRVHRSYPQRHPTSKTAAHAREPKCRRCASVLVVKQECEHASEARLAEQARQK